MDKEFSNFPQNFNINGLKELKDFVGTRSQLYSLISDTNPLAIIDKRQATVYIGEDTYLIIMQKAKVGMKLRLIWKIGEDGGEYFIQDDIFRRC